MRDDLRIAVGDESMSARPELVSALDVIEKLTVEHYRDAAVLIEDRLLAVGQPDNTQSPRSQTEPGPNQKAFLVRAAVQQCPRHSLNASLGHGTLTRQIDHACDAAHQIILL